MFSQDLFIANVYNVNAAGIVQYARVPSLLNIKLNESIVEQHHALDLEYGIYFLRSKLATTGDFIEQRWYAHQQVHQVMVHEIHTSSAVEQEICVFQDLGAPTVDFNFRTGSRNASHSNFWVRNNKKNVITFFIFLFLTKYLKI